MSWSGPSILDKLSEIPPQYEVLKQGLLRVNQESVLQSFDGMANQLNNSGDKFKNFDETIDVYTQALEYYPDSEKLSVQLESILRERQSIIFDITSRINLLLEQSRYNEVDNNSIPQLILDLHEVDKTYVYQVSPTHFENYKKALENAIAKDDVVTQSSLISVGKAILDKKQKSEVSFESLLQRESAIIALTDYQDKLNQGKEVVFPSNAALVFYEQRFERYSKQLTVIDKYKDLIALEELIDSESTILPNDFPLLVSIRQELSKRYITMANSLMKKRMYRTAETLVERSEAITKSLDSIML
tara:strand:+ start:1 stop:906 length:906 start_codon:yes stop_codon:yes gene_type:complete